MSTGTYLFFAALLVFLNAFFVAAEFALVKVRSTRVQELVREGVRGSVAVQSALQNIDAYLSATQFGITLASLALGWIGEPAFAVLLTPLLGAIGIWSEAVVHSVAIAVAFAVITYLHIVLGELAPKFLAINRPEEVSLIVSPALRLFYRCFSPALWFLRASSNRILGLMNITPTTEAELAHSEEELRLLLTESHRTGSLSASKRKLLENVFDYTRRSAKHIMVPRAEIVHLSLARPVDQNLETIRQSQHTRYPLCDGDIDHVVGMIHSKDLFQTTGLDSSSDLLRLKRDILFVPESRPLELLQRDFQQRRLHMAIVVDEYGGTSGLVTLEDILEEIVGEIQDEFDTEAPRMQSTPDGHVVDGLVLLEEIAERLGIDLPEGESATLGGYVIARLGRIAKIGDFVELNGFRAKVIEMKGRRVSKLLLIPEPKTEATEGPEV